MTAPLSPATHPVRSTPYSCARRPTRHARTSVKFGALLLCTPHPTPPPPPAALVAAAAAARDSPPAAASQGQDKGRLARDGNGAS